MPVDLDGRESYELPRTVALWDAINDVVAASGGSTTNVSVERQKAIVRVHDALWPLAEELCTLRARVAELEEDNEWLRWVVRASCVRTPTPGCDCPGCETARERAAQVDLVESYEAELEEDRQAERDRILGARVREIARALERGEGAER